MGFPFGISVRAARSWSAKWLAIPWEILQYPVAARAHWRRRPLSQKLLRHAPAAPPVRAQTLPPWRSPSFGALLTTLALSIGLSHGSIATAADLNCATPDATFRSGFGAEADLRAFAIQSDGQVLVGGFLRSYNGVARSGLVRLSPTGTLDSTFSSGAGAEGTVYRDVNAVLLQPDGRILVGGRFEKFDGQSRSNLVRLLPSGAVDTSFRVPISGYVNALALDADGMILVGGEWDAVAGTASSFGLFRLLPTGLLDPSFVPPATHRMTVHALLIRPDGRVLVGGSSTEANQDPRPGLLSLNSNGSVDRSFEANISVRSSSSEIQKVNAIGLDSAGRILVAGNFEMQPELHRRALVRLDPSGHPDEAFAPSIGADRYPPMLSGLAVLQDDSVVIAGDFQSVGDLIRHGLAQLDSAARPVVAFDPGKSAGPGGYVTTVITTADQRLLAGGSFDSFAGQSGAGVVLLHCSTPTPVPPWILRDPVSLTVVEGLEARFVVLAGGSEPLSFQWMREGQSLVGATGNELAIAAVRPGDAGRYTVSVSNTVGRVVSSQATLRVTPVLKPPTFRVQSGSQSVNLGEDVVFSVEVEGTAPFRYQWLFQNNAILGATNSTLRLTNTQPNQGGTYQVRVTNPVGATNSQPAVLTVVVPPPRILQASSDQWVRVGENVEFEVLAAGFEPLRYQWLRHGNAIAGAIGPQLQIPSVKPSDQGQYAVTVTDPFGETTTHTAFLTVFDPGARFEVIEFRWAGGPEARLWFEGDPSYYYILFRGPDPALISEPLAFHRPTTAGRTEMAVPITPPADANAYFRVRRIPVANPADVDADGIDDLFEISHPGILSPFRSEDAALDLDDDWLTNLEEYRLGTSLQEATSLESSLSIELAVTAPAAMSAARPSEPNPGTAPTVRARVPAQWLAVERVDFLLDGRVMASATTPPYEWQPESLPPGGHELAVRAELRGGGSVRSDNVQWVVPSPLGNPASGATAAATLAFSVGHALAIANDGTLWGWGANERGQLGLGSAVKRAVVPTPLSDRPGWRALAAGAKASLAIHEDGSLWSAGNLDLNGATGGVGSANWVRVGADSTWQQVFVSHLVSKDGFDLLCATRSDGSAWVWGRYVPAPFSLGSQTLAVPAPLPLPARMVSVSEFEVGSLGPLFLLDDGGLYLFEDGKAVRALPSLGWKAAEWGGTAGGGGVGIKEDGTLWWIEPTGSTAPPWLKETRIGAEEDWESIDANSYGTFFALKSDGTLWRWHRTPGLPTSQWMGVATREPTRAEGGSGWTSFFAAEDTALGLRQDGTISALIRRLDASCPPSTIGGLLQQPLVVEAVPFNQPWAKPQNSKPFLASSDDPAAVRATDLTGNLPVQFAVDSVGAATFSLPISVPPGTAGTAPSLAISYHSRGGNGLLGMGASLSGLSTITRCAKSIVHDGEAGGVRFDDDDRFCLDGQRLVAVGNGAYGQDGTEYRTEIESFTRIRSYGRVGNGPRSWRIWTKGGQILEFGNTDDSRLISADGHQVLLWAVSRIEDIASNAIEITYFQDPLHGEYAPLRIDYGGNRRAGTSAYASVEFGYASRSDPVLGRVGPYPMEVRRLLKTIRTAVDGASVFTYTFTYEEGHATGRSRLASATLCNAQGVCFPPTRFEQWTDFNTELFFDIQEKFLPSAGYWADAGDYRYLSGDFNGDGRTDLLHLPDDHHFNVWLSLGNGRFTVRGFNHPVNSPPNDDLRYFFIPGDFNGDGRADFLHIQDDTHAETWLGQADGSFAFVDAAPSGYQFKPGAYDLDQNDARYYAGDWDGDGRTDLIHITEKQAVKVWISVGDGTFRIVEERIASSEIYYATEQDDNYFPFDIDGDGRTDLVHFKEAHEYWVWFSQGGGHFKRQAFTVDAGANYNLRANDSDFRTGDFNGDGRTDFIHFADAHTLYVWMSQGDGRFHPIRHTSASFHLGCGSSSGELSAAYNFAGEDVDPSAEPPDPNGYKFSIADFNGDGRTDLLQFFSNTEAFLWISRGDGTFKVTRPFENSAGGYGFQADGRFRYQTGDFDGDGRSDVVHFVDRRGLHVWRALGEFPDLLQRVTDGQENVAEVAYRALTDAPFYTAGAEARYPEQDLRGPLYVVERQRLSDGRGGLYELAHKYVAGRTHLTGHGFLGFARTEVQDSRNRLRAETDFLQSYPLVGQIARSRLLQPNGRPINVTTNVWDQRTLPGQGLARRFVFNERSEARTYELDGSLTTTVTTTTDYDDLGNPTRIVIDSGDGYIKTIVNAYRDDVERWLLARLVRAQVTSEAPGQPRSTRTSAFEYRQADGLLESESIEPDHPTLRLDTRYRYDAFGNRIGATVEGDGIEARSSGTAYDARGRFPVRSTNALGHVARLSHDARFGEVKETVDPNGFRTTWEYDGFGRRRLERRPDETTTTWTYAKPDRLEPSFVAYLLRTADSGRAPVTTYLDKLGRTIRTVTEGLDGRLVYQDTDYDALGRVRRTSRPYFQGETDFGTEFTYDLLGRVRVEKFPDKSETTTDYQGLETVSRNAKGQTARQWRNSQGQLEQVEDDAGSRIRYEYDAFGNLLRIETPGRIETRLAYDLRGRKTRLVDPDMGAWSYTNNVLGELVAQRDAKGQVIKFRYDKLGRLVHRSEPEGETHWVYDTAEHGLGALAEVRAPGDYRRVYAYDSLGRPSSHTLTLEGSDYAFRTSYDTYSRPKEIHFPSGVGVSNEYNSRGYLTAIENLETKQILWRLEAQNAAGQRTQESLGNGLVTTRRYDPRRGWLEGIFTGPDNSVQHLLYGHDLVGNVDIRRDRRQGLEETFRYDNLNRLTNATIVGRASTSYAYNRRGGLTYKSDVGVYEYGSNGAGPNAVTRAGTAEYRYDANGNQIAGAGRSLALTSFNKPSRIERGETVSEFTYGPDRARLKHSAFLAGVLTTTLYLGMGFEIETTPTRRIEKHYLGPATYSREWVDGTLAETRTRYLHTDHLGSVESVTDESRTVVERYGYDPHGKRRGEAWNEVPSGSLRSEVTEKAFTGHVQLDALDIIHMGGRVYDPILGRMLNADPIVQSPGDLQSHNRYSYVLNNPLTLTDPSGYFSFGNVQHFFQAHGRMLGAYAAGAAASVASSGIGAPTALASFLSGAAYGAVASKGNVRFTAATAIHAGASSLLGELMHGSSGGHAGALQHAVEEEGMVWDGNAVNIAGLPAPPASSGGFIRFDWRAGVRQAVKDFGLLQEAFTFASALVATEASFGASAAVAVNSFDNLRAGIFETTTLKYEAATALTGSQDLGVAFEYALDFASGRINLTRLETQALGITEKQAARAAKNEMRYGAEKRPLTRAGIRSYLEQAAGKSPQQIAADLQSAGLKLKGSSPDGRFMEFVDKAGNVRAKLHPPDAVTQYPHLHVYDSAGNPLSATLKTVPANSPAAHIPTAPASTP